MNTKTHRSNAERFGHWLGGVWRGYTYRERQAMAWLVAQGVPAGGATALLWVVKLCVLAILFYAAFWLALMFLFVIVAAWITGNTSMAHEGEWRNGQEGHGYYENDVRTDYGRVFEEDDR